MVTKIVSYQCDICKYTFDTLAQAKNCEARGKFSKDTYPVGLLHADLDFYPGCAFALAELHCEDAHYAVASLWACRDNGYGDSLGEEKCGNSNSYVPEPFQRKWLKEPPMKRLIAWLRSQKITPMVWVKGKAIPLHEACDD